jgi:hypothetical protein
MRHREVTHLGTYVANAAGIFMHLLEATMIVVLLLSVATAETVENNKELPVSSPLLHPGKLDSFYSTTEGGDDKYNLMLWSPVFKGGYGTVSPEHGVQTTYGGGFFRPFTAKPSVGDLIVGLQYLETGNKRQTEVQGEYRFPFGLGIGGGVVERKGSDEDITFSKLSYRNSWNGFRYIASMQQQKNAGTNSPGGYLGLYDESWMGIVGTDGEQWRGSLGFVTPKKNNTSWRPAAEVLYVDNSIGKLEGSKFLFVNATLGFRGGFLSHPARLGRAMGPTGLEFGNPLGFLSSTFNRRLNVWELGGIADFRLVRLDLNNSTSTETWETIFFPWQVFDAGDSLTSGLFLGPQLNKSAQDDWTSAGTVGYFSRIRAVVVSFQTSHNFNSGENSLFLGLIYPF